MFTQCAACFKIHQDDVGDDFIAMIFGFCADCCEKESIQIGVGRNAADLHKLLKDSPWQVLGMTDVEEGTVFTLKQVDGGQVSP